MLLVARSSALDAKCQKTLRSNVSSAVEGEMQLVIFEISAASCENIKFLKASRRGGPSHLFVCIECVFCKYCTLYFLLRIWEHGSLASYYC